MMERGIPPMPLGELWTPVKSPFVESVGTEELIGKIKQQLEAKYNIQIDLGD
jgi:hypothetical protein